MERRHSLRPITDRASYLPPHGMRVRAHAAGGAPGLTVVRFPRLRVQLRAGMPCGAARD